jgi:hypothetical protein
MVDPAMSAVDVVMEEDRTTLAPGQHQRVVTMCLTMDIGQLWIRCKLHVRKT